MAWMHFEGLESRRMLCGGADVSAGDAGAAILSMTGTSMQASLRRVALINLVGTFKGTVKFPGNPGDHIVFKVTAQQRGGKYTASITAPVDAPKLKLTLTGTLKADRTFSASYAGTSAEGRHITGTASGKVSADGLSITGTVSGHDGVGALKLRKS